MSAPPLHENARGNGQVTTGQSFKTPQATRPTVGTQAGSGELPPFLKDLLSAPPRHGEGVHQWLFRVARHLHAHRSESDMADLLAAASYGCGRHVPEAEILGAIADSRGCAWTPSGSKTITKAAPKWPTVDKAKRLAAIEAAGVTLADLWDASPTRCTPELDADFFADQLFPGNPLLCVGKDKATFRTAPRESFRGRLSEMSLVVPSPMSALMGKRKADGEPSAHTLDNTGERRFLITEFDQGTSDEQAALVHHLSQFAPLVLVLTSGGKSLHAWWNCQSITEAITGRFMRYAVSLGADHATWTRSQFVRLPQGWRADKGRRQEVYYYDHSKKGNRAQ